MSTNSSVNKSLSDPELFSNDSFLPVYLNCYVSGTSSLIYLSFMITNFCILLPLCVLIFHYGHQRQRQQGFCSSSGTSHADSFTYHLVAMELMGLSGCVVCSYGICRADINIIAGGNFTFTLKWFGEMLFHVLTCVERYLAVVHPVTYLKLKSEKWIRVRGVVIGCVWLFCVVAVVLVVLKLFFFMDICLLVLSLTVIFFCSLSVLCVLIHSGPGEPGRGGRRADQSKRRAFNTIGAILGVLVVKFVFNIIWEVVYSSQGTEACLILTACTWFNLPSSLVLPLLFLFRKGTFTASREEQG